VEMMGWFFLGVATEQDVIDHLNKPDNKGVKLRAAEHAGKKGSAEPAGIPTTDGPAFMLRATRN